MSASTPPNIDISQATTARLAGVFYLVEIICGIFSYSYVTPTLVAKGDAAATIQNIFAGETLFRLGIASDLVTYVTYLLCAFALYVVLKPVNRDLALLFVLLTVVSVAVMSANVLNHVAVLDLVTGEHSPRDLESDWLQAQVMSALALYRRGMTVAAVFFGLWLLPLGVLVYRSGYFPRILGVMLIVAGMAYLFQVLIAVLLPQFASLATVALYASGLPEISFCLWLLVKGATVPRGSPPMDAGALAGASRG